MAPNDVRTCSRCGTAFHLPRKRRGTPYAQFCSQACITAHKVDLAQLHSSQLEEGFAERLREAGLAFVEQYALGPYVVDLAFPQVRLLVEVDGEAYHASSSAQARDDRKDALAASEGWQVIRVPQFMIEHHPEEAVRTVVEAYLHGR
ncbi:Protein of unknown function [Deinococcus reticulitermitis]|uniref:Restriction endonuclease type II-like domain-containing protein n=2 Tax=Deinococcus TaxID=1298 RepID=A0A1H7CUH7_9DEIO|nr:MULTISPECIES: DUF559 domain-containing protein [Deinococcus]MDL2343848.1 DUF559 domain-containing protein [Deinococcus rhizophilus]SEJ89485.1 Protein of unknown function [Deinococcus reticulitermitis]